MLHALSVKISDSMTSLPAVDLLIVLLSAYCSIYTLYDITASVLQSRTSMLHSTDCSSDQSSSDSSVFSDLLLLLTSAQLTPTLTPRHTHMFVRILCDQQAS